MLLSELSRMNYARKWMKSNEAFLPTWHAFIGYRHGLFDTLKKPMKASDLAEQEGLNEELLNAWIDTGLAVGHLKQKRGKRIQSVKAIQKQMSSQDPKSVGVLLEEMMTLHIPTLLHYDQKLALEPREQEDNMSHMVAETSSLIEGISYPKVNRVIKKTKAKHILDLGSGYGGYLKRIAKDHPDANLIGIDKEEKLVKEAQNRNQSNQITFRQDDILSQGHLFEKLDLVMLNNALYYFSNGERSKIFDYVYQSLRENGHFTMITPLANHGKGREFPAAFNSFMCGHEDMQPLPTEKEIKKLAKMHQFKIKTSTPLIREGGWHFFHLVK
ncbi:class I SAM-dependent methyltransferase [Geomicrobium sp. JCM 19038]|uniref:class I SAM-dependent methyltransferase n=1 Tax=Geomicrobium sp. JCM 19038 TaxID=1460635 RepID=UPI00045F4007|nr:class I SAM-dependent methyltransferase [Geomicrobium sp. JCM 19038]GAK06567.1 RedI protein [Geomicrobium sp. JCM 19038]